MADIEPPTNAAQVEYWNAAVGDTWVRLHEQLDRQIAPFGRAAMRALGAARGERILDIGCGCGETSLDLARQVGAEGQVTAVDISRAMLAVGRDSARAAGISNVDFRECDAQTGALGRAAFDGAFSRFGVMFFADPVAAFQNIRAALKPAGRLAFACWRPLEENVWMRVPIEAARPFLPPMTPPDPLGPGPYALSDPRRVESILAGAGFGDITITPFDTLIGSGDVDRTLGMALQVGPLGSALREYPDLTDSVSAAVRDALAAYDTPDGVMMPGAVWIVRAVNG